MNAIAQTNGFALKPTSMQEAMAFAKQISSSQMVPKNYQGRPDDTLVAMMMGSELGLNPIQALQNIAVINGKPAIYGDALLALVQNHPKFGGHEESFDEQAMAATCTVWRKGDDKKHTVTFSRQDAEHAKLWGKQGPWQQYPKRMLMWRARGYALRDKFADALGGLITVEEARDIPEERDITPPRDAQPAALPEYPQERLEKKLSDFRASVDGGTDPQDIIGFLESKYTLNESQRQQILGLKQGAEA